MRARRSIRVYPMSPEAPVAVFVLRDVVLYRPTGDAQRDREAIALGIASMMADATESGTFRAAHLRALTPF